jgi:small subunit ribosomal protein S1
MHEADRSSRKPNDKEHGLTEQIQWLTEEYDYERPKRGQVREGVIVKIEQDGITVDVGLKRDGFVPDTDLERFDEDITSELEAGQSVEARVVRPAQREDQIILSMYQARLRRDWRRADELLDSGEIIRSEVIDFNKGGLIVKFGGLRGFVPGSHLWDRGRRHSSREEREELFAEYVGQELPLKVIEVNRDKRRLVLSERRARREKRKRRREDLLEELMEGQVVEGIVRRLAKFGAFVDLGGADGLVHVSELAWQYVDHPSEVLDVGDKVKVYILKLDHERNRIALSLKRLQPHPWELVDQTYSEGQIVSGKVTGVADFGAFVSLDVGVEGLVHISELGEPAPQRPEDVVKPGDELVLRILEIDSYRHRIGLSLKEVTQEQREAWLAQQAASEERLPEDEEESQPESKAAQEPAPEEEESQPESKAAQEPAPEEEESPPENKEPEAEWRDTAEEAMADTSDEKSSEGMMEPIAA